MPRLDRDTGNRNPTLGLGPDEASDVLVGGLGGSRALDELCETPTEKMVGELRLCGERLRHRGQPYGAAM